MIDRSTFLAYDEVPTKDVPLPEFGEGVEIRVRCLTTKERLRYGFATQGADAEDYNGPDPTSYLIAVAAVNDDGSPVFSVQDAESIANKRGDMVERIAEAVLEVSGITKAAAVDAEGKSDATPNSDSPTNSPSD